MGIRDRPIAPHSPWQNGCAERLIGSIRRDCLDHVVVFGEQHLRHLLKSYQKYYNEARTHLSEGRADTAPQRPRFLSPPPGLSFVRFFALNDAAVAARADAFELAGPELGRITAMGNDVIGHRARCHAPAHADRLRPEHSRTHLAPARRAKPSTPRIAHVAPARVLFDHLVGTSDEHRRGIDAGAPSRSSPRIRKL
jgi:hypothetical protein